MLQKHPVTQPLKSPRWNQKDRCWHASGNDRQCLSSATVFHSDQTLSLNMCWGVGLPSSGKLAESRDIAAGLNIAYFNLLIFYLIIVIKILL